MSEINLPVKWQESLELPYEGLYFVAVRYSSGFGTYDFAVWNGEEWELELPGEVVGWVDISEVLSLIKADWPQGDKHVSEEFMKLYEARKRDK
ncbi:hypothetical protein BTA51_18705 [Hahella sp. CCB-MM4]|uniref:hypothetical protein n=1 Tax=Hahella sp. (strain CCB-MM4) TaxID=1926491 RepID=UPI000B9B575A|nr:hypothetical protein [Hahella sp. CCB-MM4]OZG71679.1 hypothetical protein BTA51_18705 [Hahella sp. CCB-MM4]